MMPVESHTPETIQTKGIIVFDFDGTITTKDTFALFLRYYAGTFFWALKIITLLPMFLLYKLRLIDRHAVKAAVIKQFFAGEKTEAIDIKAKKFAKTIIPSLVRPAAQRCLNEKKKSLESLYICSASISPYLKHWASAQGILEKNVLAVELQSQSGILTGAIEGYNVWGENKVRRIHDEFRSDNVQVLEAYGDSEGDKELLNAAKASFYKPFRV